MIIELLLTMALDMTLPEFQPEIDASGNYIVGTYDVSTDEIVVEELPVEDIPILEDNMEIDDSVNIMSTDEVEYLPLSTRRNCEIKEENGQYYIRYRASYNYYIQYTLLSAGVTYNIDKNGNTYIGLTTSDDSEVYLIDTQTYTPSTDIYIIMHPRTGNYMNISIASSGDTPDDPSGNDPDDPSGNDPDDPSGNDPDDTDYSELIKAVNDVYRSENAIALILMFMAFCPFLTKVVDKLMFRKED